MERDWLRARSGGGVGFRFVGRFWKSFRSGCIGAYPERSLGAGVCIAVMYSSWRRHTQVDTLIISHIGGNNATIFPFQSRCGIASIAGLPCCLIVKLHNIALGHPRLREVHFERH